MTERRVNVRLAAVGGDKLKADLVSIGREGRQALRLIEDAGAPASAGLSMAGQAANDLMGRLETLAARAARAAANMNEMATSGSGVLSRINTATGVSGGMVRDSEDIAAYGRALDDLRAKLSPLFAEQRRHADAIAEIDRAAKVGAITLDEWVSATRREEAANAAAANSIRQRQAAFDNFVNSGLRDKINELVGVTGELARTQDDIEAYGRALDDARAKFNPLFAEERRHADALAEIDRAHKSGAISMQEWEAATRREIAANEQAAASIRARLAAMDNLINTGLRDHIDSITGVSGVLARSADDIAAYGQALDDVRAKFNPMFAEERRHAEALAEIDRGFKSGALSMQEWETATRREIAANEQAAASIRARLAAMDNLINTGLRDRIDSITGVSGNLARSADDVAAYGKALDDARAKYNPMFAAIQRYRQGLAEVRQAHAAGAISADEMTAAISRLRQASLHDIGVIKGRVQGYQAMEKGAGMARFQMIQLGYQLNDIGVSLASGQNPLIVMVQQGAQIAQIYGNGQGGVSAMFRQIGGLIRGLPGPVKAFGIAAGFAAIGVADLTREINKTTDVTVNFGDTAKAIFQVIGQDIKRWIKPAVDAIAPWFQWAWDKVVAGVKWVGNMLINGMRIAVVGIDAAIKTIPPLFEAGFKGAKAVALRALGEIVDGVGFMIDGIAQTWDSLFGTKLAGSNAAWGIGAKLEDMAGVAEAEVMGATRRMAEIDAEMNRRIEEIRSSDPMGDYFDRVREQAIKNAIDRQKDDKKGKGGKSKKEERDEADQLIKSLERELAVLKETDPIKKKMLEYSEQLKDATDEQKAKVLELVTALDQERHGWNAIGRALREYAEDAKRIGDDIGQVFTNAFGSAEEAVGQFVKTGKLDFSDLVTSMLADLAKLGARMYILGPLSNMMAGFMDPLAGALRGAGLNAVPALHAGGRAGSGALKQVSPLAFLNAPRLHSGTPLGLRSDEYAAILQRGERVLNRRQTREWEERQFGGPAPIINFNVRDAQSIRQSRTQLAADASRMLSMAGRGR